MSARQDGKRIPGFQDCNLVHLNERTVHTWYQRLLEDKSKSRKEMERMIAQCSLASADLLVAYLALKAQSGEGCDDRKEISALIKQHSVGLFHFEQQLILSKLICDVEFSGAATRTRSSATTRSKAT